MKVSAGLRLCLCREGRVSPAAAVASWPPGGMDEAAPSLFFFIFFTLIDWSAAAEQNNPQCKLLICGTILWKKEAPEEIICNLPCDPAPTLHNTALLINLIFPPVWYEMVYGLLQVHIVEVVFLKPETNDYLYINTLICWLVFLVQPNEYVNWNIFHISIFR